MMRLKNLLSLLSIVAITLFSALSLSSCSEEAEETYVLTYSMGCTNAVADDDDETGEYLDEIAMVEQAFEDKFSAKNGMFSVEGTIDGCNSLVISECREVASELIDYDFTCSFTYTVKNLSTGDTTYEWSYDKDSL